MADPLGAQIDAAIVERAFLDTLKAWFPLHLAHQERLHGWAQASKPLPRAWLAVSEWTMEPQELAPPAVVVLSPGTVGVNRKQPDGSLERDWRLEVAVVVGGKREAEARSLASAYLMALGSASREDLSLGGVAKHVEWTGPDEYDYAGPRRKQRAIYASVFVVTARTQAATVHYDTPPTDPYIPTPGPPLPLDVEIDIEVTAEDQPIA